MGGRGRSSSASRTGPSPPRCWPSYHRLIERFGQATGTPVLMNTSFNLRGERIVTTPQNAYSTFARSELELLVMGEYLVEKTEVEYGPAITYS